MTFKKSAYKNNGNLAVVAYEDDGEMYGALTVNILPLPPGLAALDTNNFPDAEDTARRLGAVHTCEYLFSGFCEYPVYDFTQAEFE